MRKGTLTTILTEEDVKKFIKEFEDFEKQNYPQDSILWKYITSDMVAETEGIINFLKNILKEKQSD